MRDLAGSAVPPTPEAYAGERGDRDSRRAVDAGACHNGGEALLRGAEGERALGRVLSYFNRFGGRAFEINRAMHLLTRSAG